MKAINSINKAHYILFICFLALLLIEPISKLIVVFDFEFRIKAIVKLTFLFILIIFALTNGFKKEVLFYLILLPFCFIIGQLSLKSEYSVFHGNIIEEIKRGDIYIFSKYAFILVFVGVYEKFGNRQLLTEKLVGLFILFMTINTLFSLIGFFVGEINIFKTYPFTSRFGYQGLIERAGESVYFYIISVAVAYKDYLRTKNILVLGVLILGSLLLGKKGVFIFIFLLLMTHMFYFRKYKWLYITTSVLMISTLFYKTILNLVLEVFPFWEPIYNSKGLLAIITSKRNFLLADSHQYIIENWNTFNFLFGGVDFRNIRSEFGFFDLFLTFGITGVFLYGKFIYGYLIKNTDKLTIVLISAILITDFFSGGLLINVMPMILLYLSVKYISSRKIAESKGDN